MKCSAFIAASVDGYIATRDGGVEWLDTAANPESGDRPSMGDGGFGEFLAAVDCMIMGRGCAEKISSFGLSPQAWPYGKLPIHVLSRTLEQVPPNLHAEVEIVSDPLALVEGLRSRGFEHAYVDGGATITSFIELGLLDEICVTQVPVLLGDGLPLFGFIGRHVGLESAQVAGYSNDFVQWSYRVKGDA